MSLNPFNPREPKTADIGLRSGEDVLPLLPGAYTPCKGEPFFTDRKVIVPVEPFYSEPKAHDAPVITISGRIDREPPFYDQTDMAIATPCVSPYQWEDATGAALAASVRTIILDTVPDADATDEEKALPGYVANPGLLLSSRSMALFTDEPDIAITAIQAEWLCRITTAGDSDWTAIGAPNNNVGTEFTATGPGTGTGVATHIQAQYDDKNGVAFLWSFPLDRDEIAITSTVNKKRYKVTKKGDGSRAVGEEFVATGAGSGTAKVTLAPLAHPLLRTGQTRYSFPETTLVGTAFAGDPFIPGEVGKFTSGNLSVCAYRYGFLLGTALWYIAVKIGRGKATWNKAAKTLTLACDTEHSTIYYSTDGSAPTTEYTGPISVTDTKTVRWYARKLNADTPPVPMMLDSDEWQTVIAYAGAVAPDDFETVVFSSLEALRDNNAITIEAQLQRAPTLFIAPAGTGDGDAPDDPSTAAEIIGVSSVAANATVSGQAYKILSINDGIGGGDTNWPSIGAWQNVVGVEFVATGAGSGTGSAQLIGKARGERTVTASRYTGAYLKLIRGGSEPQGCSTDVDAGSFTVGRFYRITTVGSTNFTLIGAAANTVGEEFKATGTGSGTGKASRIGGLEYTATMTEKAVTALAEGDRCVISEIGNTNFTMIGADANTVGSEFVATGAGTGTGKALAYDAWADYEAPIAEADFAPGIVWFRRKRLDDTPYTRDFRLPWFLGDITMRAVWDKDAGILTLSIDEATAANVRYLSIWYGTGASADTLYTGPITVTETTTFRLAALHTAEAIPYDFSTATDDWVLDEINPASTVDFTDTEAATLDASTVPTQTFTQSADLVWASEGTYTNPTGNAAAYFYSESAIVIRGGYNTDFTARDAKNTKTIFKAAKWGAADAESINTYSLYGVSADGVWFESDMASALSGTGNINRTTSMSGPHLIVAYNCHIDWTAEPVGGAAGVPGTGPVGGAGPQPLSVFNASTTATAYYYCTISIVATMASAAAGGAGPDLSGSGSVLSNAGHGGKNEVNIAVVGTATGCTINLSADSGDGGTGGAGGTVTVTFGQGGSNGGLGGTSTARATAPVLWECAATITASSGNGGIGGSGGTVINTGFGGTAGSGGVGADTTSTASAGTITGGSATVSAESGNAGAGGASGTGNLNPSFGAAYGGDSSASATVGSTSNAVISLSSVAGDGGAAGAKQGTTGYTGQSGGDTESAAETGTISFQADNPVTASVEAGAGGAKSDTGFTDGDSIAYLSSTLGAFVALTGSVTATTSPGDERGYWICGPTPCSFAPGAISVSESHPYGAGNPIRVDHAAGSTIGWYSGLDDGDGAPLSGYTTPQGTGVALGRYWE